TRLEVLPERQILSGPAAKLQLRVVAHTSDGGARDVTGLARFSVNDEAIAVVSPGGSVERRGRGEAAVTAEYRSTMATASRMRPSENAPFVWPDPPESNYVDRHVFAKLRLLRIAPSPLAADAEF